MRRPAPVRFAAPLCLLALSACSSDLKLPDGATVTCTAASDCPSGYTCVLEAGRCVRTEASFDVAKVVAASVTITPELPRARGAKATLAFELDRAVKATPTVRLAWLGGDAPASLLSAGAGGKTFSFEYTVGSSEPEGSLTLVIDTVSDAGVPSRFEKTRAIELDFTPPVLVPDTLSKTYRLPAGSVVDSVNAIGLGGEATVLFAVNEPTTGTATLELEPAEALGQSCGAPVGSFFSCKVPLPSAPAAQGAHAVFAVIQDVAGNPARLALGSVTLDTVPPAAPDVVTAGRVLYTRVPQGTDASGGLRAFSISAAAGAVEPGARVVAFDGAQIGAASRIGTGLADGQGAVPAFALVPADRARVYVAAVDAAGNVSDGDPALAGAQAVQVRDVEWSATLAGKVALDPFSNPHRLRGYGLLPEGILTRSSAEVSDTGTLGRRDGVSVALEGAGTWARIDPRTSPPAVNFLAYTDTWRGELRAIPLNGPGGPSWRFTGSGWQAVPVLDLEFDGSPERAVNGVAFDAQRGELVLAGSNTGAVDTWVLADQSWRLVPGSGAPPVEDATMVYDENLGQVLLFGGQGAGGFSGDTWAWDGSTWNVVATTGPQPRSGAYAVFDPSLGKVVLFGGVRVLSGGGTDCGGGLTTTPNGPCRYQDTWLWDGKGWTRACDSTTADCGVEPTSRTWASFAYDPVRRRAVLFGGGYQPACVTASTEICTDFYEWDGSGWSRPTPADPSGDGSPPGRVLAAVGWDPVRNRFLVSGGEDEFLNCGALGCQGTWQWTGTDWLLLVDPARAAPSTGGLPLFAYDGARSEVVMGSIGFDAANPTWAYNLRTWTSFPTGNPPILNYPTGVSAPNAVYEFGGYVAGTGNATNDLYRRQGTTWTTMPATTRPTIRADTGATYVAGAATPHLLLFGGFFTTNATQPTCPVVGGTGACLLGDTWGYGAWGAGVCGAAATCWRQFAGAGPSRRSLATLVATTGSEALLFGGSASGLALGDTWRWNGSAWTQLAGAGPSARYYHLAVWDSRRGKVVLASGGSSSPEACGAVAAGQPCQDVWEHDGSAWRRRRVADPELDGNLAGAVGRGVYSTADGGVYAPDSTVAGGLWRWDGGFGRRPALVAEFDFSAAGAPSLSTIERVDVSVTGAAASQPAVGSTGTDPTDLHLLVGEPLGWRRVAAGVSGTAGTNLSWCASRAAAAGCELTREGKQLLGRNRTLLVAAAPGGTNGTGVATISLDYAEVKVRYRMPDPAEE